MLKSSWKFILSSVPAWDGGNIGVSENCQVASESSNAPSAYEFGERLSDSLWKNDEDMF